MVGCLSSVDRAEWFGVASSVGMFDVPVWRYWHGVAVPPDFRAELDVFASNVTDLTDADLPADWVVWLDGKAGLVRPDHVSTHRANMLRWKILSEWGGVWLDHDVRVFDSFPDVGVVGDAWTGGLGPRDIRRSTAVLAFPAGHVVPALMLDQINRVEFLPGGGKYSSFRASGSWLLERVCPAGVSGVPLVGFGPWAEHLMLSTTGRLRDGSFHGLPAAP